MCGWAAVSPSVLLIPAEHLKGTLPTEPSQTTPTEVLMGPSNAICIQMFCLDEQYEMR